MSLLILTDVRWIYNIYYIVTQENANFPLFAELLFRDIQVIYRLVFQRI